MTSLRSNFLPRVFTLALFGVLGCLPGVDAFTRYDDDSCRLIGDTDIYGVGVRVGYYLNFFSGTIALIFNDSSGIASSVKATNAIYFAILVVLMRNTLQGSYAVFEWYIATNITFVLQLSTVMIGAMLSREGMAAWGIFFVLYAFTGGLQPWLFWTLLDQGRNLDCESFKMFIFVSFDFYNPKYIKFLKAMSILACLTSLSILIIGLFVVRQSMKGVRSFRDLTDRLIDREQMQMQLEDELQGLPSGKTVSQIARKIMIGPLLFGGIIVIVSVEKILSVNHVDMSEVSFTSTGQLIPFLVGLSTLISTLWSIKFRKAGQNQERERSIVLDNMS